MDNRGVYCDHGKTFRESCGHCEKAALLSLELRQKEGGALFIGEAQDLSSLSWELIRCWYESIPDIHIAGDDDQSIYVWRGAGGADVPAGCTKDKEKERKTKESP